MFLSTTSIVLSFTNFTFFESIPFFASTNGDVSLEDPLVFQLPFVPPVPPPLIVYTSSTTHIPPMDIGSIGFITLINPPTSSHASNAILLSLPAPELTLELCKCI